MTCHEFASGIVDLARGLAGEPTAEAALREHLADCGECAARLQREERLTAGLRALSRSMEAPDSGGLGARLLERFDLERTGAVRAGVRLDRWYSAAAVLVMVVGLAAAWRTIRAQPGAGPGPVVQTQEDGTAFVPWPGAAALPDFESGELVRTELPVSVLPLLGFQPADAPAGGRVLADVLYGQDGLARAVRLVRSQSMQP